MGQSHKESVACTSPHFHMIKSFITLRFLLIKCTEIAPSNLIMDLKLLIKLNYIHYTLNTIISVNPNQKLYGVTKTWILATAEAWNLPKWYMSIVSCNNTSWGPLMGLTKDTIDLSIHFISYRLLISRSLTNYILSPQNVFDRLSNPKGLCEMKRETS